MRPFSRNVFRRLGLWSAILSISLVASLLSPSAFAWQQTAGAGAVATKNPAATLTATERKAAARLKLETIRAVTAKLSSPEFEGRGTGQPGADRDSPGMARPPLLRGER